MQSPTLLGNRWRRLRRKRLRLAASAGILEVMRWTEKQIEDYLQDETRQLTSPDGHRVTVTLFRTYWITYDAIRVDDVYTENELVAWAQRRAEQEGIGFTEAFRSNLGLLDREIDRQHHIP